MRVRVNGQTRTIDARSCVADLARLVGVRSGDAGVAVAVDGEVVPHARWESTPLAEGCVVEIVRAAAGG